MDEEVEDYSREIKDGATEVPFDLLPNKSREKYNLQHKLFVKWCASKKIKKYSESVILTYLSDLSLKYKASTLLSIHSMLKATLLVKDNVNIEKYAKVTAFLRDQLVGYTVTKSRTFDQQDIEKFLQLAPDVQYLIIKVALIIGVFGACHTIELTKMRTDDVVDKDGELTIHVPNSRACNQRTFKVRNAETENSIDVVSMCKKYFSLRPRNMNSRRLFVKYHDGKCAAQNVGQHTIRKWPSKIASYLNLPHHKEYTGQAFRRTSATLLADPETEILVLKRRDDWKSTSVAEDDPGESFNNQISVGNEASSTCPTIRPEHFPVLSKLEKVRLDHNYSKNHESDSLQDIADGSIPGIAIKEEIVEEPEDAIFQIVATIQNHHQTFQSSRSELEHFQNTLNRIKTKAQWVAFLCSKTEEESADVKIKIEPFYDQG